MLSLWFALELMLVAGSAAGQHHYPAPPAPSVAADEENLHGAQYGWARKPQTGLSHPPADMGAVQQELVRDPKKVRELVAPGIIARLGTAPTWTTHSDKERTSHLLRHVTERRKGGRRLQYVWDSSDGLPTRNDSWIHDLVAAFDHGSSSTCIDPLASNTGAGSSCLYDCDALRQAYSFGEPSRCFIYDPSTRSWPLELLELRQRTLHNTITIPNDESWVIQGNIDPETGLPVSLDARLSSGTPLDRSHANIVVRYVRFSGQIAPIDLSGELIGRGVVAGWYAGQHGTYGGAFRYEGGSDDHANPVRLTFERNVFDHNRASAGGGIFINGRAGHNLPMSTLQNWDSGIAATWESCVFFRNFGVTVGGGLAVVNVWPMTFKSNDCDFIQNSVTTAGSGPQDGYLWDSLADMGGDRRTGITSLELRGNLYDGGGSTGLISSVFTTTRFLIDGTTPSEPDAVWNVTLAGVTYRDHTCILAPLPSFTMDPPDTRGEGKLTIKSLQVSDLTLSDNVALVSHAYDSLYFLAHQSQGNNSIERARFERNGRFSSDALGSGGFLSYGPGALAPGFTRPVSSFAHSEWNGNSAGRGAAIYVKYQSDLLIEQCLFRHNVATIEGGAIYYFSINLYAELLISRSVFEANAARPAQTNERIVSATVVTYTDVLGEEAGFKPVWRIDDGPVYGLGWEVCQAVMSRSRWSVLNGYDASWPSQEPSSCANESYHVASTYSTVEVLAAGTHTLWHGVVAMDAGFAEQTSSWIKVDDVTSPIFPEVYDYRTERFPSCGNVVGCMGPDCCPLNEVFWSNTEFRVSIGRGGAVSAAGRNAVRIRDSIFRVNEAPGGASLQFASTHIAQITNTSIDVPMDEWSGAIATFASAVDTCISNPCPRGNKCVFRNHSTFCEACRSNEVGDGTACAVCEAGQQPNLANTACVSCERNTVSTAGVCHRCAGDSIPNEDHTDCEVCPKYQSADEDGVVCECQSGFFNVSAINPVCYDGDFDSSQIVNLFECKSCKDMDCVGCDSDASTPVLLPGFVQFVPWLEQIDVSGANVLYIFECESKFGCHGTAVTGSAVSCISDRYEGHFCASCVSGFHHVKADGEYEYECVECENAHVVGSVLVLAIVASTAGGISTLLWRKYKPANEAQNLAFQATIRSVWVPIRCIIVYAQVNSQLGDVLDVRFPAEYTEITGRLASVLSISDILIGSECAGLSSFFAKWLKDVVIQPAIMLGLVALYWSYERKASEKTAAKHATGHAFFVVFFCYPSICNTLFASFICKEVAEGRSILAADDRVMCEDADHETLKLCSFALIALIACGVPIGAAAFLRRANDDRPPVEVGLQHRVALDHDLSLSAASDLINEIKFGSSYGFIVSAYRPSVYMWESVDMARKLALVGFILMFGRGSVLQLASALFVAVMFMMAQGMVKPFKTPHDNRLRLSTELHTVITILIASTIKADPEAPSNESAYDVVMVVTFLLMVVLPFIFIVGAKLLSVKRALESEKAQEGATDEQKQRREMAILRFQLGLQDSVDRETMLKYFEQPTTGEQLWRDKIIASHLTREEMCNTLAELEAQLPKSHQLGYHFTSLDTVKLVLGSLGIRASSEGQLGGGVSICLTSPDKLGWGKWAEGKFAQTVGEALWGSKWYEVMAGEPWQDLKDQIDKGGVKGKWPAAYDEWGNWNKKLEAVFVVKIPSMDDIPKRRMVPGREDCYIVPQSDCVPDEKGAACYYSNENIIRCFILVAPLDKKGAGRDLLNDMASSETAQRVVISSTRDQHGGMQTVSVKEFVEDPKKTAADQESVDEQSKLHPKVLDCIAVVAQRPKEQQALMSELAKMTLEALKERAKSSGVSEDDLENVEEAEDMKRAGIQQLIVEAESQAVSRHRAVEQSKASVELRVEDVARFTTEEMRFALAALDHALLKPYSLAYCYTNRAVAESVRKKGSGIASALPDGRVTVCTQSPVDLGWDTMGRGDFGNAIKKLSHNGRYVQLEVVIVVAVPTIVLSNRSKSHWCTIPDKFLVGNTYSNAHIQKCYDLGCAETIQCANIIKGASPHYSLPSEESETESLL